MGLDLEYINGQTPLDEEEKQGLLIPTIANRGELDEFEQQNIEEAIQWVLTRSLNADTSTQNIIDISHQEYAWTKNEQSKYAIDYIFAFELK